MSCSNYYIAHKVSLRWCFRISSLTSWREWHAGKSCYAFVAMLVLVLVQCWASCASGETPGHSVTRSTRNLHPDIRLWYR